MATRCTSPWRAISGHPELDCPRIGEVIEAGKGAQRLLPVRCRLLATSPPFACVPGINGPQGQPVGKCTGPGVVPARLAILMAPTGEAEPMSESRKAARPKLTVALDEAVLERLDE